MAEQAKALPQLLEIAERLTSIDEELIALGGELTAELEQNLAVLETQLIEKVDNYAGLLNFVEGRAALWKAKKAEAEAARKACENVFKNLEGRIKLAMVKLGKMELAGKNSAFKLVACTPSLEVENEKEIPEIYKKQIVVWELDKAAVKADLMRDIPVPGAYLTGGQSLRQTVSAVGLKK